MEMFVSHVVSARFFCKLHRPNCETFPANNKSMQALKLSTSNDLYYMVKNGKKNYLTNHCVDLKLKSIVNDEMFKIHICSCPSCVLVDHDPQSHSHKVLYQEGEGIARELESLANT